MAHAARHSRHRATLPSVLPIATVRARLFEAALKLVDQAIDTWREVEDRHQLGKAILVRAVIHDLADRPSLAFRDLGVALTLLNPDGSSLLCSTAVRNLASALIEGGNLLEDSLASAGDLCYLLSSRSLSAPTVARNSGKEVPEAGPTSPQKEQTVKG